MSATEALDWISRGRAYLDQGAPVDAMLWLQRAARAAPHDWEANQLLAEALQRLGRGDDARAARRAAIAAAPERLEPLLALAEASLANGDAEAALAAAARAGRLAPSNVRPLALHAVARLTQDAPSMVAPAAAALAAVLEHEPSLLALPAVAGPLARAIDAAPDADHWPPLLARIAALPDMAAAVSALLLALAVEHAARADMPASVAALALRAAERDYAANEHDALRRIALTVTIAHGAGAARLRERYARLCATALAAPLSLLWPRRTAGTRLRLVALVADDSDPVVASVVAALASLPPASFDVVLATLGSAPAPSSAAGGAEPAANLATLSLPTDAGQAARRIAACDPDVLVDLAGLTAAVGPLLAQRPARAIVTLDSLRAPVSASLVDRSHRSADDLIADLRSMAARVLSPTDGLDTVAMAALWDQAVRAHQRGDRDAARAAYDRVLELQPGFASGHHLRAMLEREEGDLAAARADFGAALAAAPTYVDARVAAAAAAIDDHAPQAAAELCAEVIDSASQPARLLRAWGLAELKMRNGRQAEALFERALALEPAAADTHYNHGVALQMQRRHADAARAYQRALALDSGMVAADFNLGVLFQEQGALDAATTAYASVLAQDPTNAAAYRNLGETLLAAGRLDAALANLQRFEANCPDTLWLVTHALEAYQRSGDFGGVDRCLDGLRLERYRAGSEVELCDCLEQLLYLQLFFDVEPAVVFRLYRAYDEGLRRVHGEPLARPSMRRPGPIRVGYLSADLREHVMGKMVWQQVRHHDRTRFSLHFYSLSDVSDEWTARFRGIADRFVELADVDEREAATRILDDDLDLLVDLSTHTKGARPGILALKPARVLITHVASAGTVGLSTIDFKLTDRYADVAENQEHQLEALLPMDGCVYPFRRIAPAATHPFRREALGLDAGAVLIGAFVTSLKLSRRCLALWREVLERIPRARLVFSPANPAHRDSYVRLAAAAGIPETRLLFLPQGRGEAENQARYALIDFVLDPMPYGGVNGTLEALDMGVPVVTLVGRRHAERTSYSMLANLGVTQTIAESGREYVDIAARLADEPAFNAEVRAAIATGLAGSVLADAVGHTRNLEAAYRHALALRAPEALADAERAAD